MQTKLGISVALALGIALSMAVGSGWVASVGGTAPDAVGIEQAVNQANDNSSLQEGVEGSGRNADGSDVLSFLLQGGGAVLTAAKLVLLLPIALMEFGAPLWFAVPVGGLVEFLTAIGVVQFLSGRVYK